MSEAVNRAANMAMGFGIGALVFGADWRLALGVYFMGLGAAILSAYLGRRPVSRLRWWLKTRRCECHWQEPYGAVVMAGCPRHD